MTDPASASIIVHGAVAQTETFTRRDLAELPGVHDMGSIADGKVGQGVRLSELLDAARPAPRATHVTAISADGRYRASIPIPDAEASGWIAFAVESEALPSGHGGPFRLTVADGRTLCWNVKDLAELKVTVGPEPDDVPERPPH
jgi:DMSO/TMAO reductase YedYZ molybdopterin-dependent catalytic subunit